MQNENTIDLVPILKAILKKWWVLLIAVVVGGVIAFGISKVLIHPTYQTKVTFIVSNAAANADSNTGFLEGQSVSNDDMNASQSLVYTYSELLTSRTVLSQAVSSTGYSISYDELKNMITTEPVDKTQMIDVAVTADSPEKAYNIASAVANAAPSVSGKVSGSSIEYYEGPVMPEKPYSPNLVKNAVIGALIGLLIALVWIAVLQLLDKRIKNADELEARYKLPVIGTIPNPDKLGKSNNYYYAYENTEAANEAAGEEEE